MKLFLSSLFFISFILMTVTPLYSAQEILSTYYPAPSGNYNKIQTNYMQLGSSTLNAIQGEYKCSYDPLANLPPCPAGIVYYDTNAHTLFFSDGDHWKMVVSSCIPLVACPISFGCGTDSCGNSCGTCIGNQRCSTSTPGTPGNCN